MHFTFVWLYVLYGMWLLRGHYKWYVVLRQHYMSVGDSLTPWFGGDMPYFVGAHTCPASGCRISLNRGGDAAGADMLLYHLRPADYGGGGEGIPPPARGGRQLVGLMLAEGFDAAERPASLFARFNAEHSFRPSSLVRDSYILWFVNDAHKQGIGAPQRPLRTSARAWEDIWEPPLPAAQRSAAHVASWGSHYCRGARSGREDYVRALLAAGLRVAIFGEDGNCLRNLDAATLALDRGEQFRLMRTHKFYLAFENHRLEGYVSEKVRAVRGGRGARFFSFSLSPLLHAFFFFLSSVRTVLTPPPPFDASTPPPPQHSSTGRCCAGRCL